MSSGGTTIFERILAKEIPASVVYEDEHIFAFKDINPQAPVHVLVIPKRKVKSFTELAGEQSAVVGELFVRAAKVATQLGLDRDGYRVVTNVGKHGQQSVDYIHLHILGGRQMQWPPG